MEPMQIAVLPPEAQVLHGRWAELADWALNDWPMIIRRAGVAVLFGALFSWNVIFHMAHKKHFDYLYCPKNVTVTCNQTTSTTTTTTTTGFTSISAAVDSAPQNSSHKFCIFIRKGVYRENVIVGLDKTNLVFIGEGINKTIIKPKQIIAAGNDQEVFNRSRSPLATLVVKGKGFIGMNLTIESAVGPQILQTTVAVENWAEQSVFYNCSFVGQNVSLYTRRGLQFYRNCYIQGTQHFISGYAKAVFQQCIVAAMKLRAEDNTVISLAQQSPNLKNGLVFHLCDFLTVGRVGAGSKANTYLGGQSDNFTTTVVMQSFLDASIAGWLIENSTCKSYYAEYLNAGPGSSNNRTNSVCIDKINDSYTASQFTVRVFLKGQDWLPSYVPHDLDLV